MVAACSKGWFSAVQCSSILWLSAVQGCAALDNDLVQGSSSLVVPWISIPCYTSYWISTPGPVPSVRQVTTPFLPPAITPWLYPWTRGLVLGGAVIVPGGHQGNCLVITPCCHPTDWVSWQSPHFVSFWFTDCWPVKTVRLCFHNSSNWKNWPNSKGQTNCHIWGFAPFSCWLFRH